MSYGLENKLGLEVSPEKIEGQGRVYRLPIRLAPRSGSCQAKCLGRLPTVHAGIQRIVNSTR